MDHQFDESYPFVFIGHVWRGLPLFARERLTKKDQMRSIEYEYTDTGVCTMHFAYFIVLLYSSFSSQLCFVTLWIDCITFYQFF